tara:strand:+ start:645 stop:1028 length:384 start_codon:yes stop_codon:yes gene_type:complete
MIKNFLIINCTGKDDLIGLKLDNKFFVQKFQTNSINNDILVNSILDLLSQKNVDIDEKFSIIVNSGPGRFSSIRASIAVAKGIQISKKAMLFSYSNLIMPEFNLENIEFLIKKKLLENKLIKPIYIS